MEKTQSRELTVINVLGDYINDLIIVLDILNTPTDKLKQVINELENTNKKASVKELSITVSYLDELTAKSIKDEITNEQFVEELVKVLNNIN